jgi:hypothetical protein
MKAFLTSWMSREVNRGSPSAGSARGQRPAPTLREPV